MAPLPTVSVITITLNDLDGLKRTVESVRAQQYEGRIEHIVLDGGSGSDVVEYLTTCEPAFTYWQSEPDAGRYDAMNQGIARASGDLLWFMHSADRFSDPYVISEIVEAMSEHGPVCDLWGYGVDYLVGLGTLRAPMPFSLRKFLMGMQVIPHQASFFGSRVVSKLGGYDLDFGITADQEFMLRAALLRDPITIQRLVCFFDTRGAGSQLSSREAFQHLRHMWDVNRCYPFRGRLTSLAILKLCEYAVRPLQYVLGQFVQAPSKDKSRPADFVVSPRKPRAFLKASGRDEGAHADAGKPEPGFEVSR